MDFTDGVIIYHLLLYTHHHHQSLFIHEIVSFYIVFLGITMFYMCKYCLATRDTIEMTTKMAEAGADAALVVTPCFYKNGMTSEALEKHFTKVSLV